MGSDKREACFGMIETLDVSPGSSAMARLAPKWCSVGAPAFHPVFELPVMGILMAGGTISIFKVKWKDLVSAAGSTNPVAFRAGHSGMRAHEWEPGLLVLRNSEGGAVEVGDRVAILTPILIGGAGKLGVMRILVAVCAVCKAQFVNGVFARWNMALDAVQLCMLPLERIFGCGVLLHAE
jgi:hypothetical protein